MRKKVVGIMIIFIIIIGTVIIFNLSKEKSSFTKVVNYNGNSLMISIDGVSSDRLPTSGSYYLVSYDCKSSDTKIVWDKDNYTLDVSNGNKRGGVLCYLEFETNPKLSDMEVGSYVQYTGNNGCVGDACNGQNANYVDDNDMGYCFDSSRKYIVNGWRIGYVDEGRVYLVSAGATDCACTIKSGVVKSTGDCISGKETAAGFPLNMKTFSDIGLKYCNKLFVDGGECSDKNSFTMDEELYSNIIASGFNNDLIDNGGFYWFTTIVQPSNAYIYRWYPFGRSHGYTAPNYPYGVRPTILFDSNVRVIGGSGTYEEPYEIGNDAFWINNGVTTISNANKNNVNLSLISVNASKMCISTNTSVCTNYVNYSDTYTLNWTNEEAGEKIVYVYYKDSNGRVIASMNRSVVLAET